MPRIDQLPEESAATLTDLVPLFDTETSTTKRVTLAHVLELLNIDAGANVTITGTGTSADPYIINASGDVVSVNGETGVVTLTKADIGLTNVDDTSDADKPVSTAQATAIGLKKTDSMATNKVLGRGTAGTGAIEEITLGTNLSLSGTTLNATGGASDWGDLGGTLADQTDLQAALNAKQDDITVSAIGSSGPATLVGTTLNIPEYASSGGDGSESNLNHSLPYKTPNLNNWFTALETANTTPVNVVIIGDSISVTTAFGVTKPWGQRMVDRFTERGRTPIPEASWRFAYGTQVLGMTSCDGALHSPAMGMGGVAMDLTTGQKATQVATMDGISVVYSKQSGGGNLEVRDGVGGTLLTTISTAGTAKSSFIWTSNALTRASHTIEITSVGNTILEGVYVHDGTRTKGVRVWTASKSGYTSQQFVDTPSLALDLLDNLNPDLVIIATGTNDGSANYATYMENLIDAVQAHSSCDIALWFPYGSTSGFNSTEEAAGRVYIESAPFLAYNIPVIDAGVGTPNISTRYSSDGIHPSDIGAEYIAQHIYSVVGGDPLGQIINYGVTNKIATESLDTLKAPKASPTFTGTVTASEISGSGGNSTLSQFFGFPYLTMKETGNTYSQFQLASAAFNNALAGFNAPGFTLGSGSAAGDTNLYRSAANVLKTDDNLIVGAPGSAAGSVATIDGTQTLTNKTVTAPVLSGTVTGTYTIGGTPTFPSSVATLTGTQTLTNKTLTSPVINTPTGIVKGDVGLGNVDNTSNATERAATATLTNKTLTAPVINNPTGFLTGAAKITVGTSTPGSPTTGDIWIDTN